MRNPAASIASPCRTARAARAPRRAGFTLLELLLTIAVLSILAALLIPQLTSDIPERLDAAAQVVVADLEYARALAVSNNSTYTVTFDPGANSYYVEHTGANNLLDVLPPSAFRSAGDPPNRQTTALADLPIPAPAARLIAAVTTGGVVQPATSVIYQPLGGTQTQEPTVIWLACGEDASARFISIEIHPVTGLAEIGSIQAALPSDVEALVSP